MSEKTVSNAYINNLDQLKDSVSCEDYFIRNLGWPNHKKTGSSIHTTCPKCNNTKKATITRKTKNGITNDFFKCHSCGLSYGSAYSYIRQELGKTNQETAEILAGISNVPIEYAHIYKPDKTYTREFCDMQLASSGLTREDTKSQMVIDNKGTLAEIERYTPGSFDDRYRFDKDGTDMVLHYLGLDRKPIMYYRRRKNGEIFGEAIPYYRVRFQVPEEHTNKYGKSMKYGSPPNSGVHLWYPEKLIQAYERSLPVEIMYVVEGEKKADSMTKKGLYAVGTGGIHGIKQGDVLHQDFRKLIVQCSVQTVVFLVDADWDEPNLKPSERVESRAQNFKSALSNFKNYFEGLEAHGINVSLRFMYINKIEKEPENNIATNVAESVIDENNTSTIEA